MFDNIVLAAVLLFTAFVDCELSSRNASETVQSFEKLSKPSPTGPLAGPVILARYFREAFAVGVFNMNAFFGMVMHLNASTVLPGIYNTNVAVPLTGWPCHGTPISSIFELSVLQSQGCLPHWWQPATFDRMQRFNSVHFVAPTDGRGVATNCSQARTPLYKLTRRRHPGDCLLADALDSLLGDNWDQAHYWCIGRLEDALPSELLLPGSLVIIDNFNGPNRKGIEYRISWYQDVQHAHQRRCPHLSAHPSHNVTAQLQTLVAAGEKRVGGSIAAGMHIRAGKWLRSIAPSAKNGTAAAVARSRAVMACIAEELQARFPGEWLSVFTDLHACPEGCAGKLRKYSSAAWSALVEALDAKHVVFASQLIAEVAGCRNGTVNPLQAHGLCKHADWHLLNNMAYLDILLLAQARNISLFLPDASSYAGRICAINAALHGRSSCLKSTHCFTTPTQANQPQNQTNQLQTQTNQPQNQTNQLQNQISQIQKQINQLQNQINQLQNQTNQHLEVPPP